MEWNDSSEQAAFRSRIRKFFDEKLPPRYRSSEEHAQRQVVRGTNGEEIVLPGASWESDRLSEDPEVQTAVAQLIEVMVEEGFVAAAWPKELGGAGLTTIEQFIFGQERERAGAPRVGGTGAMFLGSLLMVHGTPEQQAKWMPAIARGEIQWAQGYSEPGAGSDLASLQLRAQRDGDEYVLNGQKIWSTPQVSNAMYCLVRTDPDAPKHRGISFIMIDDLFIEGVEARSIENICFGHESFGETFFTDVRVPVENLVGEENRGWYVSMTLMDFDRASISTTGVDRQRMLRRIEYSKTDEGQRTTRLAEEPVIRAEVAERVIEADVGQNLALRLASMQAAGLIPNYEASMGKLFSSELGQRAARTGARALGLYTNLWPGDTHAPLDGEFGDLYVRTIPYSIRGGSSEIQRNVIAGRGLGLPRG